MPISSRPELYDALSQQIAEGVPAVNASLAPLEIEVFFADELLFGSATVRAEDGSILWRSSHAATPDSTSIPHLADAGADVVARIISDARLAEALNGAAE